MKTLYSIFIILMATLTVFCGPSTGGDDGLAILAALEDGGGGCIKAPGDTTTTGSGTLTTIVNATASGCWVYIDLKAGGVETTKSGTWDLRFKRFVIGTNSGTSGSGDGGSCFNPSDTNLASVTGSDCTLEIDKLMSQTGGGGFGTATENASPALWDWYDYDGTTHILSPKARGYLIQGSDGVSHFGLEVLDYYDGASTSGFPSFKWKVVP
ncbi:heme-binding protein HmuY [Leptospira selangorensis]|uniref:Heme-binding protein HmuY n=1 Tax=Leptospira selangorensis TaxID=2484982 RepID=A0A5F2BVU8_9LEPT|nr:HmuY family protein [Leptospira selangorensis]TGM11948.1 heme-binding protein HmuY [Leptospira selangorensis]TGM15191.1 heme-binding protein HmuY [Leptospira selangorensis]